MPNMKDRLAQLPRQAFNQGRTLLANQPGPAAAGDVLYFFEFETTKVVATLSRKDFEAGFDKLHAQLQGNKPLAAGCVLALSSPDFEAEVTGLTRYMMAMSHLVYCQFGPDKQACWNFLTWLSVAGCLQVMPDGPKTPTAA